MTTDTGLHPAIDSPDLADALARFAEAERFHRGRGATARRGEGELVAADRGDAAQRDLPRDGSAGLAPPGRAKPGRLGSTAGAKRRVGGHRRGAAVLKRPGRIRAVADPRGHAAPAPARSTARPSRARPGSVTPWPVSAARRTLGARCPSGSTWRGGHHARAGQRGVPRADRFRATRLPPAPAPAPYPNSDNESR